ncbi:MAG: hypothetical protein HOO96_39325 [Polyangiaceae bacterium]|nr:hypothetical protein [Polyangiaceae bacterium]
MSKQRKVSSKAASSSAPTAPARRRAFTLVELLVSLVAGLLVAMAVMGLSRVATTTFHEEARASGTELGLRVAAERLRADLSRAAYMSTTNIQKDPFVSKLKGETVVDKGNKFPNGLAILAGIAFTSGGSAAAAATGELATEKANYSKVASLSANNGVAPDSILLGGNMTTADEYIVQSVIDSGGEGCGGQTVTLSRDSAAVLRLVQKVDGSPKSDAEATSALDDAFVPATGGQFMARIVDDSGHQQFVALCPAKPPAVTGTGTTIQVMISPDSRVLSATETGGNGGITGFAVGRITINPVQLVRWSLRRIPNALLDTGVAATDDAKFDLVRTWVDAKGNEVKSELIAEYATDLVFSFAYNDGTPTPRFSDFGAALPIAGPLAVPANTTAKPEQLRSVRFRLSLRTPMGDRAQPLAGPDGGFLYRYRVSDAGENAFARVRTIVSEVNLQNQFR